MINLVLMPESFICGMAASKRVGNFIPHLLNKNNFRLTNIVLSSNKFDTKKTPYTQIKQLSLQEINPFIQIVRVNKILRNLFSKQYKNVIYYYGYPDIFNIIYLIAAKRKGYKIVFDIVENNFVINKFNSLKTKLRTSTSRLFFKHLNKIADGVICISTQLELMIRETIVSYIPILYLPITINKKNFPQSQEKVNSSRPVKIFYGGSYGAKDGLNFLLDAFDIVANEYNVELILSGKGNLKDENRMKNDITHLKHKGKIKLLGYLSDEEYYKMINSVDIHCMTRIASAYANFGFPFKLGEMLASGKPVIVTKVGDVEKFVYPNTAVLIEPESVEAIAEALKFLINYPEAAHKIGSAGRECAFINFEVEKHAGSLTQFLEDI